MKRVLATTLVVTGLIGFAPGAVAQLKTSGSVTGGGIASDANGYNKFRFEEYRDLSNGATLGVDVKGDSDKYYLRFFGENIGRDDQFIEFKGGSYGRFKYSLYNDDIVHNLTSNAITPYTSGIGSGVLSFAGGAVSTNVSTWTPFSYSIKHENFGGMFELQSTPNSPFYIRATGKQKQTTGIRPLGVTTNSPGGAAVELPAPVDYTTTDASGEIGWLTKTTHFSVNLAYSKFVDHIDNVTWRLPNQAGNITDQATLAADNQQWKLGANATWRKLPLDSTLSLRGTYSTLTNDLPVRTTWRSNAALSTATASTPLFSGDVVHETLQASWAAQPSRALDSRVYYYYDRKKNDSTQVVFTTAGACDINPTTGVVGTTCTNEAFHYRKHNLGVDLGYRFDRQNKISGGWDYVDMTRERIDYDETKDNKLYIEWKNTSLENLSAKIKYQYLQRRSDFKLGSINPLANSNNFANFYNRRYDLADNDQDLVKLVLDSSPVPFLDLGAEFIYKRNDFKTTTLGRTGDTREEMYLTAGYGDANRFRVTAFFDYEQSSYDSTHWNGAIATFPIPAGGPPSTAYLWNSEAKDKNYLIGLAADWKAHDRLRFKGALIWQDTDGTADFANNGTNVKLIPIGNYDSFRKWSLNLSSVYAIDKQFDVTAGYAYENYKYSDVQMDGYNYTAQGSYFSGAYAFPNYNANIIYVTLTYKFQ